MQLKYNKTTIEIEPNPFAGGGEGNLFRIIAPQKLQDFILKLYHLPKRTEERLAKIEYLYHNRPKSTASIVWVHDIVFDQEGAFLGFIMPFVKGVKLENLCLPKVPKKLMDIEEWQRFDFKNSKALELRLRLCFNLAVAIHQIHDTKTYVLVDLKPDNIVAQSDGILNLVDTDSMEVVQDGKTVFDAPVATPEYTPPEFYRKKELSYDPTMFPQWDLFGGGVIFYKLLLGIHPFAATGKGGNSKWTDLAQKIEHGLFVQHPQKDRLFDVIPAPHRAFERLPKVLQELFLTCFVDGHLSPSKRPIAKIWATALRKALKEILTPASLKGALLPPQMEESPFLRINDRVQIPDFAKVSTALIPVKDLDALPVFRLPAEPYKVSPFFRIFLFVILLTITVFSFNYSNFNVSVAWAAFINGLGGAAFFAALAGAYERKPKVILFKRHQQFKKGLLKKQRNLETRARIAEQEIYDFIDKILKKDQKALLWSLPQGEKSLQLYEQSLKEAHQNMVDIIHTNDKKYQKLRAENVGWEDDPAKEKVLADGYAALLKPAKEALVAYERLFNYPLSFFVYRDTKTANLITQHMQKHRNNLNSFEELKKEWKKQKALAIGHQQKVDAFMRQPKPERISFLWHVWEVFRLH